MLHTRTITLYNTYGTSTATMVARTHLCYVILTLPVLFFSISRHTQETLEKLVLVNIPG
jgi:hypothetical protein